MHTIVGHCPKCGAPVYTHSSWSATIPPPSIYSCMCKRETAAATAADGTGEPHHYAPQADAEKRH